MKRILPFVLILLFLSITSFAAGDEVPGWLLQLRGVSHSVYEKTVPAVVLLDEAAVSVDSSGKNVTTRSFAVKILLREGRREALARIPYLMSGSRIRDFKGWIVRADGSAKTYSKDQIIDKISDPDDVYDEYRVKIIDASSDADAGTIFGFQATIEESPLFHQDIWYFQDSNLPVLQSRYTLSLPQSWQASSITFNRPKVEPVVNGSKYIWELRNLPSIPEEPESPSLVNIVPRIAVNYFKTGTNQNIYNSWKDVSLWYTDLSASSLTIDDNIAAKARELTANAKTEFEKIQALASYVQNIQYISLQLGVAKLGGHRPRPANLVLQRGYGDCKDKANLMRAMLKVLKIDSYLVLITAGDPTYVREEWASPQQFNHCIIAVKISDAVNAPSVINHEKLGRLLIFDATDPYTQLGDLPDHEQGSFALIAAGSDGGLTKMPVLSAEASKVERQIEATINEKGDLAGLLKESSVGQPAAFKRGLFRSVSSADFNKIIEQWIVRGISTAHISKITPLDKNTEGRFDLDLEFNAPVYGQLMQNRLLVFRPAVVSRLNQLWLTESKRTHPIILDSHAFNESASFQLPAGFVVDEMPEPLKLETSFGKYTTNYEVKDGKLTFSRSLVLNAATIPVEKYGEVQKFFSQMRTAEQSPVVLLKK